MVPKCALQHPQWGQNELSEGPKRGPKLMWNSHGAPGCSKGSCRRGVLPPWGFQIDTKSSLWSLSAGECCTKGSLGSKISLLFEKNTKLKIVKIHREFTFQIDIGKVRGWPCWAFWVPLGRPEGPRKDFKSHTSCPKKLFRKMSHFSQKLGDPPLANRHSFWAPTLYP